MKKIIKCVRYVYFVEHLTTGYKNRKLKTLVTFQEHGWISRLYELGRWPNIDVIQTCFSIIGRLTRVPFDDIVNQPALKKPCVHGRPTYQVQEKTRIGFG